MGNGSGVSDLNKCLETGFYVCNGSAIGKPNGVTESPFLVFRIDATKAIQMILLQNSFYFRIFWGGRFIGWRKINGAPIE